MDPRSTLRLTALVFLAGAWSATTSTAQDTTTSRETPAASGDQKQKPSAADALDAHAKKTRKLEHDLEIAELQLQVAELDAKINQRSAASAVEKATLAWQNAKLDLERFEKHTAPQELTQAKIGLDRARYTAEHAKDEHAELEAMYKADEFAEMTKELVLKRSRRQMELADRSLAVQQDKLDVMREVDHPRRRKDLQEKVDQATIETELAKQKMAKTELETKISGLKTAFQIKELQRDLEAAAKKQQKLEAAAATKKSS